MLNPTGSFALIKPEKIKRPPTKILVQVVSQRKRAKNVLKLIIITKSPKTQPK